VIVRLIDTDTASYFLKNRFPVLTERLKKAMVAGEAAISVVTLAELRYGQRLMDNNTRLARLLDAFLEEIPSLDWTAEAAEHYARLAAEQKRQGQFIGTLDTQIAAHALAEGLVLVTNNGRHFGRIPELRLENWTE
jgi:tRNA(fMet)-specific endonuclease VapC